VELGSGSETRNIWYAPFMNRDQYDLCCVNIYLPVVVSQSYLPVPALFQVHMLQFLTIGKRDHAVLVVLAGNIAWKIRPRTTIEGQIFQQRLQRFHSQEGGHLTESLLTCGLGVEHLTPIKYIYYSSKHIKYQVLVM
jgi:hypothetical protein